LNEGVVLGRIPIISRTGVGVVIFLSRGMMEMMQQVVHLCWQRKSKSCCVVFHFDANIGVLYEVQSGCTKYEVQSTKYGIRVIGCFLVLLYEVLCTKYQV
jgi:hypothetical protein